MQIETTLLLAVLNAIEANLVQAVLNAKCNNLGAVLYATLAVLKISTH
jgi:hypothetical protein